MRLNSFFFTAGVLAVTNVFAVNISFKCENGQFNIKGSEVKQDKIYDVNLYLGNDFVKAIKTNSGNSFSFSLDASENEGKTAKVKVLNYNGNGQHVEESKIIHCKTSGSSNSGSSNSGSSSSNSGSTSSQPVKPDMSDKEIHDYAQQQAGTVSNKIKNTFGKLEAFKRSFTKGFFSGLNAYQLNPYSYGEARQGQEDGAKAGSQEGIDKGLISARQESGVQANAEVRSRFEAIIDTGRSPDLQLPAIDSQYHGSIPQKNESNVDMSDVLEKLDEKLNQELRRKQFSEGDAVLTYDIWSGTYQFRVLDVYKYNSFEQYKMQDSWFRSDYAWDEWATYNRLQGKYDYKKYKEMNSSEQYRFQQEFKRIYDSTVDQKIREVSQMMDEDGLTMGINYGQDAGRDLAYQSGYSRGYNRAIKESLPETYSANFESLYKSAFSSESDRYKDAMPVNGSLAVKMIDGNRNGVFELGEDVGVSILRLVNIGRSPLKLTGVTLSSPNLDQKRIEKDVSVEIPASSSLSQAVEFVNIASIKPSTTADKTMEAVVLIPGVGQTKVNFAVSFDEVLKVFGNAEKPDLTLRNYILNELKSEYKAAWDAGNNIYKSGNTKLNKVVSASHAATNKSNISSLSGELISYSAAQGNGKMWGNGLKAVHQAFDDLANQLK